MLSAIGPVADVNAAMPLNATFTLFVGPKLQEQLQSVGSELERTVDYGITTPLAQPLFSVLRLGARLGRQLGLRDHHRHDHDQARVLQAHGDERPLDGEDAQDRAAHEGACRSATRTIARA